MENIKFNTVEEYLSTVNPEILGKLEELRAAIREAAPDSQEVISYNMPAYKQKQILVYFAAAKNHIGFYPTSSPIKVFSEELKDYKTSKGAIQFPLDEPLPLDLVKIIVQFRLDQVLGT
ncbi:MAG: hypothetical protein A2X64_00240 [Ignavibacteria bacterium GWF2_33_9]|nr:MAG: hypothetical protein A2X64_00240 [Ignavibacteria bacterium GWF2_33_9]